jgi:predicted Holliday junction resolvase-like endonuclease
MLLLLLLIIIIIVVIIIIVLMKNLRRTVEDEAMEVRKPWGECKIFVVDRTLRKRSTGALCCRGSNSN